MKRGGPVPAMSRLRLRRWSLIWVGILAASSGLGCSDSSTREVQVEVSRVTVDPRSRAPVVILEDTAHTVALPIWIGPSEAQAIAMRLDGVASPRPMTHDLIKNVLDEVGVELLKVVITELHQNTYHAHLVLRWHGDDIEIDSRPSDAIALAVRFDQPIFIAAALLEQGNVIDIRGVSGSGTVTLGGVTVQGLSEELAEHFRLPPGEGVLVSNVAREARSPLRRGDIILEVDGSPVQGLIDFRKKVFSLAQSADFSVQRGGDRLDLAIEPSTMQPRD